MRPHAKRTVRKTGICRRAEGPAPGRHQGTNHIMLRFTLRLIVAGALGLGALYGGSRLARALGLEIDLFRLAAYAGFMLAAVALVLAASAWRTSRSIRRDLTRIARSVDRGIGEYRSLSDRNILSVEALDAALSEEIASLKRMFRDRGSASDQEAVADVEPVIPEGGNIVAYPAIRRSRPPAQTRQQATAARASVEAACRLAIDSGTLELSLQPIVSVEGGTAVAFEAYAHFALGGGQTLDLQRLPASMSDGDRVALERMLLTTAAQVARRRLGDGMALPLHVPVSQALLGDPAALAAALDLFALYPALAPSVLLSVPVAAFDVVDPETLARIADLGIGIAQEGWSVSRDAALQARRRGVAVAKISSDRLLDRDRNTEERTPAYSILEDARAAGIAIMATDVRSDEDAVNLIDLGVETMCGARFSGPRRLKAEPARDKLATP